MLLALTAPRRAATAGRCGSSSRELAALYTAFAAGRPSPLAEPALQYADFAAWQRRWLAGRGAGAADRPGGASGWPRPRPVIDLPADRPRPAARSQRGARLRRSSRRGWPRPWAPSAARRRRPCSWPLLAAFRRLLLRYTGQPRPARGLARREPRTGSEIEGLIGFFVNTLALRARPLRRPALRGAPGARARVDAWAPTPTRTFPSRCWSRSWPPRATFAQPAVPGPSGPGERTEPAARARRPGSGSPWGARPPGTAKFDLTLHRRRQTAEGLDRAPPSTRPTCSTRRRSRGWPATCEALLAGVVAAPGGAALGPAAARRGASGRSSWPGGEPPCPSPGAAACTSCSSAGSTARPDAPAVEWVGAAEASG